jgi:hypothetical protein
VDSSDSGYGRATSSCEGGNELPGSIEDGDSIL